jgi:hypothetical protein
MPHGFFVPCLETKHKPFKPTMSANAAVKELKAIGADVCGNFEPSEFGEHPI